jgi:hypothetical protein
LNLRVEVVGDDGVRLHGERIAARSESATIFFLFWKLFLLTFFQTSVFSESWHDS